MKAEILLNSGVYFDFLKPQDHLYNIKDIAHSLSMINRYTGHLNVAYSVAQHSVLCSYLVDKSQQLEALMHDASEAYIGDVSSPLKQLLPEYVELEEKIEKAIAEHFCLEWPMSAEIKIADKRMLAQEFRVLVGIDILPDVRSGEKWIKPWSQKKAKRKFLERYEELTTDQENKWN